MKQLWENWINIKKFWTFFNFIVRIFNFCLPFFVLFLFVCLFVYCVLREKSRVLGIGRISPDYFNYNTIVDEFRAKRNILPSFLPVRQLYLESIFEPLSSFKLELDKHKAKWNFENKCLFENLISFQSFFYAEHLLAQIRSCSHHILACNVPHWLASLSCSFYRCSALTIRKFVKFKLKTTRSAHWRHLFSLGKNTAQNLVFLFRTNEVF